jgi:hypothetical protein
VSRTAGCCAASPEQNNTKATECVDLIPKISGDRMHELGVNLAHSDFKSTLGKPRTPGFLSRLLMHGFNLCFNFFSINASKTYC